MHKVVFIGLVVIATGAIGSALATAQRGPSTSMDGADQMMSNAMIPGFDPDAGLRAAQASSDPARRVEVLQRPGITKLEIVVGRHRAQAILNVVPLPRGLDPEKWPVTALIGDYLSPSDNYVLSTVELRVDGCAIAMPMSGVAGFTDPRSFVLDSAGDKWTLSVSNNGDSEAYNAIYTFDSERVVVQSITWHGSADARWKIDEDDLGTGRDCTKLGKRTSGSRAELKAGARL